MAFAQSVKFSSELLVILHEKFDNSTLRASRNHRTLKRLMLAKPATARCDVEKALQNTRNGQPRQQQWMLNTVSTGTDIHEIRLSKDNLIDSRNGKERITSEAGRCDN